MSEFKKKLGKRVLKIAGRTIAVIVLAFFALVASLYIPAVQDYLVPLVLDRISSPDGMQIEAGHFRLKFPLDLSLADVLVKQKGDTMLMAGSVDVDIALIPLFSGKIDVNKVDLLDVYFKTGAPDSTLYLRAYVDSAVIGSADILLSDSSVDLDRLTLSGGRIDMSVKPDTAPPTPSTPVDWNIHAALLQLRNVDVAVSMASTGDSIAVNLGTLDVSESDVDLSSHNVAVDRIQIRELDASLVTPARPLEQPNVPQYPSLDTIPWTIALTHIDVDSSTATYRKSDAIPRSGFDMDYISVSRLKIAVDSFYNRGPQMRIPIAEVSALERSGIPIDFSGLFEMTSDRLSATGFTIKTTASDIALDAVYGLGNPDPSEAPLNVDMRASVSVADMQKLFPSMREALAQLPLNRRIALSADVSGTLDDIDVKHIQADIPGHLSMALSGHVANLTDPDNIDGKLSITGNLRDPGFVKTAVLDKSTRRSVDIPPMTLSGNVKMRKTLISGCLSAATSSGNLALDASWNGTGDAYYVDLKTEDFPVNAFLPQMGVGRVTAAVGATGRGFDFFSSKTVLDADIDATRVVYNNRDIRDISVKAQLSGGNAEVSVQSRTTAADLRFDASGNLSGHTYHWTVDADIASLDLQAIGMSDSVFNLSTSFSGQASFAPRENVVEADMSIRSLDLIMGTSYFNGRSIDLSLSASDSITKATVINHDLNLVFESPSMPDSVIARLSRTGEIVSDALTHRMIDVTALQHELPQFELAVDVGTDNIVSKYLASGGTTFSHARLKASNDSLINISASIDSLTSGSTHFDRIDFEANQHGKYLRYRAIIDNKPGTMDNFARVQINGYIADDKVSAFLKQQNISGETGYSVGGMIAMTDSTISFKFVPFKPVIGYKEWTVNPDNFIRVNTLHRHIDANLRMESAESSLHLYTEHDSLRHSSGQEDLIAKISNIKISDWIAVNPYAPPMKGDLSADMRFSLDSAAINGSGNVSLRDFTYGKKRVGTLDVGIDLTTRKNGLIYAVTSLTVDGDSVMKANGVLNDSTAVSPFLLDMDLTRFPLSVANPFLQGSATLGGYLTGKMDVTGSLSAPRFDGYLTFDSATAKISMLGTTFRFSDEKIPVDSNMVTFKNYHIYGVNENPLTIDGAVDMRRLSDIGIDLSLNAREWQVVGSEKKKGADVYGKAYLSLDATAKGTLNFLKVDASVTVLPQTNVTYIIPDATSQLTSRSNSDMVKFVNFADTIQVIESDSIIPPSGMALDLTALLNIAQGSTVSVDLSTDGKNKVQLKSQGTLDYSLSYMGDSRFTGRLNINGGFVRYTPPFMSEKLFDFQEGSSVGFNGNMMNPTLNIHAVDKIKANVTQEGQNSRLISFDVALNVTGTLNEMNVAFDLSTTDDVTVQNELQSMSAEQRANQAMNLLLYNVYTGPGTKGNASLSGNPLYSFLESKLNSWVANNVKGVDISFGIDQYDRTIDGSSSTTTSYSYKVSKTLFDDRIKIVVGGNYSTDANSDENLSQNLINDISFEYMLNRSGSMYVRLFRHTGYESILEGEVTQTGVGFVYKRKLRSLRDLFRFGRRKGNIPVLPSQGTIENQGEGPAENQEGPGPGIVVESTTAVKDDHDQKD